MRPASRFTVMLLSLVAASSSAQAPSPLSSGANKVQLTTGVVFNTFGDGSEHMRKMRERLQDPQGRAELREEHRGYIVDSNYDVAEVLELDATTYEKLINLLTDQQMARLDEFHLRDFAHPRSPEAADRVKSQLERQNQEIDLLREALGPKKLERYQTFQTTLSHRRQLRELDGYLGTADKLTLTQKEQLVELLRDHYQSMIQDYHMSMRARSGLSAVMREMPSQEEMQRRSLLMTIEANEQGWRRTPEADRKLREQATFLTKAQLSALEQMQTDKFKQQQQTIEQMRLQAGLSPNIPAEAEDVEPIPEKVTRDVRVRVQISVNRGKPVTVSQIVSSGSVVSFEVDEGLLVQATPTVYANDTYELRVEYFEQGSTGRRMIGNMGSLGTLGARSPWVTDAPMGGSSSVVSGSKAYAVDLSATVEPT